jgi:hypothetical protein
LPATSRIHQPGRILPLFTSLLLVMMFFSGPALATVVTCNSGTLTSGDATTDLQVTGPCEVTGGTYVFHSVNIYSTNPGVTPGGTLTFDDAVTNFYAENIVIENGGSLIAGSTTTPIGTAGGAVTVTIHLWGAATDPGVTCVSANCGVPSAIWTSNPRTMPPMLRPTEDCAFNPYRASPAIASTHTSPWTRRIEPVIPPLISATRSWRCPMAAHSNSSGKRVHHTLANRGLA